MNEINSEIDPIKPPERLKDKHFDYVLVMGQGPVQEADKIPKTGRQGLNFYSRLIAMSAAALLREGIADNVILSGGETGSRKGTPEAQTEADLMADIIRRQLPNKKVDKRIIIERRARFTLENFVHTLNEIHSSGKKDVSIAILGIGFHTGRLKGLADVFKIEGSVFSAEEVIQELLINDRNDTTAVAQQLGKLLNISQYDVVTQMKSQLENFYIQGLEHGDWIGVIESINNPDHVLKMIKEDPYISNLLKSEFNLSEEDFNTQTLGTLLDYLNELKEKDKIEGCPDYSLLKKEIAENLKKLSIRTGINYYGKYFEDKTLEDIAQGNTS